MALYNQQAESELLGAIMQDNDIFPEVAERIVTTDFFAPKHQLIFSKMKALYTNSQAIDAISVYASLTGDKASIGISDLTELGRLSAAPRAFKTYVEIVKDNSTKRKLEAMCHGILKDLELKPSLEIAIEAGQEVYKLTESRLESTVFSDAELMGKAIEYVKLSKETKGEGLGMKTGLNSLDMATNGFMRGDFNIVAARPSMGKTAFILNVMEGLARNGHKCMFFELEMSAEKLGLRRLAMRAMTSLQRLYKGNVESLEMKHLENEAYEAGVTDMIQTDVTTQISLMEIRNKVRKLKQTKGVDVVFVDHIGLMAVDKREPRRDLQIGEITAGLKAIAKDYGVAVIGLSQLNRGVEGRGDKRPQLSDLRDSGSLEQDADIIMFLYREEYYNKDKQALQDAGAEKLEVIIAKSRDGKTGSLQLMFEGSIQRVTEVAGNGR